MLSIFDIETRKGPSDLYPDDIERGWDALRNGEGGISAIVIYNVDDKWPYCYDDLSIESAARQLEDSDGIIGFNTEKFDLPCFEGVLGRKLRVRNHYDIYAEIVLSNARKSIIGRRGENTLDAVSHRTLGKGKSGSGSKVTELIAANRFGELFNYCSYDVKLTLELITFICKHGGVQGINNSFLPLTVPPWLEEAFK